MLMPSPSCGAPGWFSASSGLILLNKHLLSGLDFHYPLTLSSCVLFSHTLLAPAAHAPAASLGMGFSSLASAVLVHVLGTHKLEHKMTREQYLRRIFPLGFLMAATLGFGNLAYLYLSVSFIQILKARPSRLRRSTLSFAPPHRPRPRPARP